MSFPDDDDRLRLLRSFGPLVRNNLSRLAVRLLGAPESPPILAKIASITIGGQARGTIGGADHYGFVSDQIGAFKVGGIAVPVAGMLDRPLGITGDLNLHEI